ncbi:unnamed protein product [Adineta ricciae]|uniref:G-protein coupled receptors family 1 profile domain-containing protein n=1 Tax=Adineta ricciae TaxID=249248 RepID=A0A816D6Q9_ADIRI|nr:unnamed protein product [Adineta ricciae]CAF1630762.1 unnamed protein product [Adineta ricciae]
MSSLIDLLNEISEQINLIVGILFFFGGLIGNIINILIFSPILKTQLFPSTPSRLYILTGSIANLIFIVYLLSTRILISAFAIPLTNTITFICKTRFYIGQVCMYTSLYSTCLATIDQYFLTSRSVQTRQLSRLTLAKVVLFILLFMFILINIPILFIYNLYPKTNGTSTICTVYSPVWTFYYTYIQSLIFLCLAPLSILILFGILIKHNLQSVRQLHQSIKNQMTKMILYQAMVMSISLSVATTQIIYQQITKDIPKDLLRSSQENLFNTIANLLTYVNYIGSFYIYIYSSKSLRKNCRNLLLGQPIGSNTHSQRDKSTLQNFINQVRPTADPIH